MRWNNCAARAWSRGSAASRWSARARRRKTDMNITEIMSRAGAHPRRRRVGRGEGSGLGKTSGRGSKGGGARAGAHIRLFHEGGAFPLFRRVAKRGFNNRNFRVEYQVVNVG